MASVQKEPGPKTFNNGRQVLESLGNILRKRTGLEFGIEENTLFTKPLGATVPKATAEHGRVVYNGIRLSENQPIIHVLPQKSNDGMLFVIGIYEGNLPEKRSLLGLGYRPILREVKKALYEAFRDKEQRMYVEMNHTHS